MDAWRSHSECWSGYIYIYIYISTDHVLIILYLFIFAQILHPCCSLVMCLEHQWYKLHLRRSSKWRMLCFWHKKHKWPSESSGKKCQRFISPCKPCICAKSFFIFFQVSVTKLIHAKSWTVVRGWYNQWRFYMQHLWERELEWYDTIA